MKLLLQHKIFIGYFLLMASITYVCNLDTLNFHHK